MLLTLWATILAVTVVLVELSISIPVGPPQEHELYWINARPEFSHATTSNAEDLHQPSHHVNILNMYPASLHAYLNPPQSSSFQHFPQSGAQRMGVDLEKHAPGRDLDLNKPATDDDDDDRFGSNHNNDLEYFRTHRKEDDAAVPTQEDRKGKRLAPVMKKQHFTYHQEGEEPHTLSASRGSEARTVTNYDSTLGDQGNDVELDLQLQLHSGSVGTSSGARRNSGKKLPAPILESMKEFFKSECRSQGLSTDMDPVLLADKMLALRGKGLSARNIAVWSSKFVKAKNDPEYLWQFQIRLRNLNSHFSRLKLLMERDPRFANQSPEVITNLALQMTFEYMANQERKQRDLAKYYGTFHSQLNLSEESRESAEKAGRAVEAYLHSKRMDLHSMSLPEIERQTRDFHTPGLDQRSFTKAFYNYLRIVKRVDEKQMDAMRRQRKLETDRIRNKNLGL